MPDYGLRIRDADANVTLDITDRLTRVVLFLSVAYNESGFISLPDIAGRQYVFFSLPVGVPGAGQSSHVVSVDGNTFAWTPYGWDPEYNNYSAAYASLILLIAYT